MRFTLASVAGVFMLLASPASAFDCAKASTDVEKKICAEPALMAADQMLVVAYNALAARLDAAKQDQLKISQRNFITLREFCGSAEGSASCILDKTILRLRFLAGGVEPAALSGPMPKMEPLLVQQQGDPKAGLYTIDMAVSVFSEPQSAGERAFNDSMNKAVADAPLGPDKGMIEFETENAWENSLSARITLLTPDTVSAEIETYAYEGGAHGSSNVSSVSLNRQTGTIINVSEALGPKAVAALVPVCKDQIITQKTENLQSVEAGSTYDIKTDDFYSDDTVKTALIDPGAWRLEPGKATITFNSYALGSYAEGRYECSFATELLNAMSGGKLAL